MSQAQMKQEQTARVRTLPPPLPRRSDIAPIAVAAKPAAKPRVTTPPPPPPAAYRHSRPAPKLSSPPPVHLALLPQWDDANAPLRPAPKKSNHLIYWISSTTISLAVGALVAASLLTVRPGDYTQILPGAHSEPVAVARTVTAPVEAAAPIPVQIFEAEQAIEFAAEAAPDPVVIAELTVTSGKAAKTAKRASVGKTVAARKASNRRAQSARTDEVAVLSAAQPDPRDEAAVAPAAEPASEPSATTAPAEVAEQPVAAIEAAPEPEPQAPALPEKLTRDQVRGGLESVRSQVLGCTNGMYGKVLADVTISAPGRVSNAVIEGTFAGTNAASCMARTLRSAKFPAFSGTDISVRYPFSF